MVEDRAALQELYRELDNIHTGDRNLILYAQYRALGYGHVESIQKVKEWRADGC